jgi:hypothetical protein
MEFVGANLNDGVIPLATGPGVPARWHTVTRQQLALDRSRRAGSTSETVSVARSWGWSDGGVSARVVALLTLAVFIN